MVALKCSRAILHRFLPLRLEGHEPASELRRHTRDRTHQPMHRMDCGQRTWNEKAVGEPRAGHERSHLDAFAAEGSRQHWIGDCYPEAARGELAGCRA